MHNHKKVCYNTPINGGKQTQTKYETSEFVYRFDFRKVGSKILTAEAARGFRLHLERTLNEQKGGRTGKPESEEELKKGAC
jgi:hypothetical protein